MKTIIITGASGQLGEAVVAHFVEKGYRVIGTTRSDVKELPEQDGLEMHQVDLSDENAAKAFVHSVVEKHRRIDAALLLAGGFAMGGLEKTGTADIRKQMQLNFETAYHIAQPVFEQMMKQEGGRLVFVGARPAIKAAAGKNMIAYGLSKSLLFKLAEYINAAGAEKNITATVVAPSTIDTTSNRKSMPDADPAKWVSPASLARIFEFVVSEHASPLRETVLKVYGDS